MLQKHEMMWNENLGEINTTKHGLNLIPGSRPFKSEPYQLGPNQRELEQFEIENQLQSSVIEPSSSEWTSLILFVTKKDGRLQFCVDYRRLNTMTVKDCYPIPRMDEGID